MTPDAKEVLRFCKNNKNRSHKSFDELDKYLDIVTDEISICRNFNDIKKLEECRDILNELIKNKL